MNHKADKRTAARLRVSGQSDKPFWVSFAGEKKTRVSACCPFVVRFGGTGTQMRESNFSTPDHASAGSPARPTVVLARAIEDPGFAQVATPRTESR